MLRKKVMLALGVCVAVSFTTLFMSSNDASATATYDVLPAGGLALVLEEGVALEEIYIEPVSEKQEDFTIDAVYDAGESSFESAADESGVGADVMSGIATLASFESSDPDDGMVVMSSSDDVAFDFGMDAAAIQESTDNAIEFVTSGISLATEKSQQLNYERATEVLEAEQKDPENFSNLVIADVHDYVNVRDIPSTDGEIVGKLYDDSVGEFIEEQDGWYKISSGNVTGYVKGEYCVTGEDAIDLAKEVGQRMATVNTTTLKVREEASTESTVLGLVPIGEDLSVVEELDGWVKVSIEEGEGYVSLDYVDLRTDFVHAESKAEEEARLEKERKAKEEAKEAARKAQEAANVAAAATSSGSKTTAAPAIVSDGSTGSALAQYACQFVGNPYVYGGTSLTNGADCSGFVMSVYKAYGVSLPHSSSSDRSQGYAVEGGLANAIPGDIVCYSGHVAIYIGNGQIVHASTSKTGIIISNANYRTPLAVRRIF